MDVVPPEVDQLAGGVDLRLERRLGLAEHGGRVDGLPPGPGEQVSGPQEDRRPVVVGQRPPGRRRLQGSLDRGLDVLVGGVVQLPEYVLVVVRLDDVDGLAPAGPLAPADRHGQLRALAGQFLDLLFKRGAFRASGRISPDWLVAGHRDIRDGIHGRSLLALPDVSGGMTMVPCPAKSAFGRLGPVTSPGRAAPGWRTTAARSPRHRRPRSERRRPRCRPPPERPRRLRCRAAEAGSSTWPEAMSRSRISPVSWTRAGSSKSGRVRT